MGVFAYENENTSSVAPARLYKAFVKDSDTLIPKAVEPIQSVEIVEGNGGPGTLKKLTFAQVKKIVGGSELADTVEKISYETKLVEGPNGGSIANVTIKYFTKNDAPPTENELNSGKAKGDGLFKAIDESYLLANPDYN